MRFKPLPPAPASLEAITDASRGVPLVPAPESDCCTRVSNRLGCSRSVAREWITYLRALGLVRETSQGFVRTDAEVEAPDLRTAFRERVYGAREVLDTVRTSDEPLTSDEIAAATVDLLSRWEHDRRQDPAAAWHDRVERLLDWAVLFGFLDQEPTADPPRYSPAN